jgi:uncharacterized membrane protein
MNAVAEALAWIMDQVGYSICHQIPERALSFGGRALPVCSRDTGLYLGFAIAILALLVVYGGRPVRFPTRAKTVALFLFLAPAAVDALTNYAGLRESSNAVRLLTGSFAGAGLAALVFPLAVGLLPGAEPAGEPVLLHGRFSLAALALIPIAISLLLLPRPPAAYWIWAPLVTLAVLFTFTVLCFTAIGLFREWLGGALQAADGIRAASLALLATAFLLAASNRLHWLIRGPS